MNNMNNMNNLSIFNKLRIILKKPKIFIFESGCQFAKKIVFQILKNSNEREKLGSEILFFETDLKNQKNFEFLIKNSSFPVLIIIHNEKEKVVLIKKSVNPVRCLLSNGVKKMPVRGCLILNFDDENAKEIKEIGESINLKVLTFGFLEGADFQASDINFNLETNFKINYQGNTVPVWLKDVLNKEQIYAVLAATAVGTIFDLNLVEISQILKDNNDI